MRDIIDGLGVGAKIGAYIWAAVGGVMLYRLLAGHGKHGSAKEDHADQMQLLAVRLELVIKDAIREAFR